MFLRLQTILLAAAVLFLGSGAHAALNTETSGGLRLTTGTPQASYSAAAGTVAWTPTGAAVVAEGEAFSFGELEFARNTDPVGASEAIILEVSISVEGQPVETLEVPLAVGEDLRIRLPSSTGGGPKDPKPSPKDKGAVLFEVDGSSYVLEILGFVSPTEPGVLVNSLTVAGGKTGSLSLMGTITALGGVPELSASGFPASFGLLIGAAFVVTSRRRRGGAQA